MLSHEYLICNSKRPIWPLHCQQHPIIANHIFVSDQLWTKAIATMFKIFSQNYCTQLSKIWFCDYRTFITINKNTLSIYCSVLNIYIKVDWTLKYFCSIFLKINYKRIIWNIHNFNFVSIGCTPKTSELDLFLLTIIFFKYFNRRKIHNEYLVAIHTLKPFKRPNSFFYWIKTNQYTVWFKTKVSVIISKRTSNYEKYKVSSTAFRYGTYFTTSWK